MSTSIPKNLDINPTRSGGNLELRGLPTAPSVPGALTAAAAADTSLLSAEGPSPLFERPHSRTRAAAVSPAAASDTAPPSARNLHPSDDVAPVSPSSPVEDTPPSPPAAPLRFVKGT